MRNCIPLPSFQGVAAGQTATLILPIGYTYHDILLTYGGATLAQLTGIRLVANGKVIQNYPSGTFLDIYNQFHKFAAAAGVIHIPIGDRFGLRLIAGVDFTQIGTGMPGDPTPITTLTIEIDIDAAAVSPTLSARAIKSEPVALGLMKILRVFNYNPLASGDFQIADVPKGNLINKIFMDGTVPTINSLKVERDNLIVFERTSAENNLVQTDGRFRTPQANWYVYDPTELGIASENLATAGVNDLRFTVNVAAAGALPFIVEYLGPLVG